MKSEFQVEDAYPYRRTNVAAWVFSHVARYWPRVLLTIICFIGAWSAYAQAQVLIGQAAEIIISSSEGLMLTGLLILVLLSSDGLCMIVGNFTAENVATRFEADARQELYASLLGKSQTFHDRQRIGDLMARATDDANQLAVMIVPGTTLIFETVLGTIVPLIFLALLKPALLPIPIVFVLTYIVAIRFYMRRLGPVMMQQREHYGTLNAGLEETISGIEVVKASAREPFERQKYLRQARLFRDAFVAQGRIEARYLPLLLYGFALGLTFFHALLLFQWGQLTIAELIGAMALMRLLQFPVFISLFAFSLVQSGASSAARILRMITSQSDLDENRAGLNKPIEGAISFEQVSFGYASPIADSRLKIADSRLKIADSSGNPPTDGAPEHNNREASSNLQSSIFNPPTDRAVLRNISFSVHPGQTVAIVGQTGSGKSVLTRLINRTYDVTSGRVLIDGMDVRDWHLDALRSQVARIEQDVFLFSRSIRENIAFGAPTASQEQVEAAAQAAQAHSFIANLPDGYDTVVGERGVTLSGGQRQRIALARAFLSDPRILILDDSTSAVDSATEDEIQRAIRQIQRGRTTLLITHRMAQIRWADLILVLDGGQLVACGTHDELLRRSPHYRRIFARYDVELPPLEMVVTPS